MPPLSLMLFLFHLMVSSKSAGVACCSLLYFVISLQS